MRYYMGDPVRSETPIKGSNGETGKGFVPKRKPFWRWVAPPKPIAPTVRTGPDRLGLFSRGKPAKRKAGTTVLAKF